MAVIIARIALLTLLALFGIVISTLPAVPMVHAISTVELSSSSGPTVCPNMLSGFGTATWNSTTLTCTLSSSPNISPTLCIKGAVSGCVLNPIDVLQIDQNVTFTTYGSVAIYSNVTNYGLINNNFEISIYGVLNNYGNINDSSLSDTFTLPYTGQGILNNYKGATITNRGIIENDGTINNSGLITNYCPGRILQQNPILGNPVQNHLCAPSAPRIRTLSGTVFNTAAPTITGVSELNVTITLYDGGSPIGSSMSDLTGNWSITTIPLSEGSHNVTATSTNSIGTSPPSFPVTIIIQMSVSGVRPGATAIYDQTVGRWNLPGPPQPPFSQFINLNRTTLSFTSVTGSNVTAAQSFTYVNGTTTSDTINGSVMTDAGNITFWFIAANLTVGTPIYATPGAPIINSTIFMIFGGATRAINVYNATISFPGGTEFLNVWWDKITGLLVHVDFAIKTPAANAFAGAQLIQTTAWSPAATDEPPVAVINFSPSNPAPGQIVGFSSFGSFDPDGSIVSNNWTFDGNSHITSPGNVSNVGFTFVAAGVHNVTLTVTDSSGLSGSAIVQVNVHNQTDEQPVASFLIRGPVPGLIRTGQVVTFDGSPSVDPDGLITSYSWNFGDGALGFGQIMTHVFNSAGNFTITLVVVDSSGLGATAREVIPITPALVHDVGIVNVVPEPRVVVSGQHVSVGVELSNFGQQPENVDITVRFNSQVAVVMHNVNIPVTPFPFFVDLVWDTSGVAAGNYTLSVSVFLATDQNPSNNLLSDGQVTVLPPPVLSVSPSQGPIGTKVTVHGSGFVISSPFQSAFTIEVTFDDQLQGFTPLGNNGSFDFVFNVPVAQTGPHAVHAIVQLFPSQIEASGAFTVTASPASVSLAVSVGSIYFPGDTAVIYVLSTSNGSPASAGSLVLSLVLPNGTSRVLTLKQISIGVYKASYKVPSTGSLGTYSLIATSQQNGSSAADLGSFEVKPTWLQSNRGGLITGTAVVGVVGTLGVVAAAWRKSYFNRRKDELQ